MPVEYRETALDPDLLTSEIGLLLDYLSGLPERILTDRPHGQLPHGCATYDEAISRYFPIDEKIRGGETLQPTDLQFLLELRDYLNAWAEPATGASIAFTTLVIRRSPEARRGKADAEHAYPEWIPMARALRMSMAAMMFLAVFITILIATLAAYIYLGSAKVENIAAITAQLKSLDEEIRREEIAAQPSREEIAAQPSREEIAAQPSPKKAAVVVVPYCDDVTWGPEDAPEENRTKRFKTVAQEHLCALQSDLLTKLGLVYASLRRPWFTRDDRAITARLNVVRGYILPVLMGLLGSMTYVLRRYLRSIGERLLTPRDLREYIVRLVLGTIFGVAIGFFTSGSQQVVAAPISSLGAPALAFLAGYAVEAVFQMLDRLADQFAVARK